ncbi:MAG: hypothetical protein ASARMPREDX12_004146 [Alectoria sarmentosa]|nr:MAG: hypothetical protein ASARMPREDX12_004146 [Alectoria sarmentosa]
MVSPNNTELPQQQATYERLTPPPTPVIGTFPNAETTQDQAQQEAELAGSAVVVDTSPSEAGTPEQENQDENPTHPAAMGASTGAGSRSNDEDSPEYLPDPFTGLFDNHPVTKNACPTSDDAWNPFDIKFRPGEGFEPGSLNKEEQDFETDFDSSQYHDEDLASPRDKGKQKEDIENESTEPSSSDMEANQNNTAGDFEDQEPKPSDTTNDGAYTPPSYEEFRDTWHNCDRCGNILRCSFRTPQAQNDDEEVDDEEISDEMEAQDEKSNEQPTVWSLVLYFARLVALHLPLFARLFPCAGIDPTGGNWNEAADYDSTTMAPGQGWNVPWNAVFSPAEAGGEDEALSAAAEERPLCLLVKYDSRPFPDPSGAKNTGERGAGYTIVSGILPSNPYPTVMAKILHRLKGTDGSHNPYPIAPTAQIDHVDIQFGAIAAHAPGFLGRRKIDEDNVGDLLCYLRQRTGGDDVLEVFLVPMNEQDAQEHIPKSFGDWMIERATHGKDGIGGEALRDQFVGTCQERMAETKFVEQGEEQKDTVEGNDVNAEV